VDYIFKAENLTHPTLFRYDLIPLVMSFSLHDWQESKADKVNLDALDELKIQLQEVLRDAFIKNRMKAQLSEQTAQRDFKASYITFINSEAFGHELSVAIDYCGMTVREFHDLHLFSTADDETSVDDLFSFLAIMFGSRLFSHHVRTLFGIAVRLGIWGKPLQKMFGSILDERPSLLSRRQPKDKTQLQKIARREAKYFFARFYGPWSTSRSEQ
jgi:hypothetical protein